ncbi:sodium:calcium antiporter [Aurantiacibacter poecillastricola]|uniref:sodium:calcium antiporter n=1 Tax=Aurantiacibacter poecillastricola TaxID=3064385 RepID=UPI002740059C|nr:hypothetical protein [Aurantiacibacter sp. 219JJ12-13]MDP5260168.1 hypothetical protein [Aurantiacibacter sp. 219JJ12-13]
MPDFTAMSLPALAAWFAAAAVAVYFLGKQLARYADLIAQRSGLGHAVIGVVMLGAITSLPEIATSGTAALRGESDMAVNNLLGSVAVQLVALALVDLVYGGRAVTSRVTSASVMANAQLAIIMLGIIAFGVVVGEFAIPFLGIGVFALLTMLAYLFGAWLLSRCDDNGWRPGRFPATDSELSEGSEISGLSLGLRTFAAGAAIMAAGTVLTLSAEGIAETTGTGGGIVGLTLLAAATSLPEFSTALAAMRLGRAGLAIGDVLGGNMFDTSLILLVDVLHPRGPVLTMVEPASMAAAILALMLTAIYCTGMIARRGIVVARMGLDSWAVLVVYGLGMWAILAGVFAR